MSGKPPWKVPEGPRPFSAPIHGAACVPNSQTGSPAPVRLGPHLHVQPLMGQKGKLEAREWGLIKATAPGARPLLNRAPPFRGPRAAGGRPPCAVSGTGWDFAVETGPLVESLRPLEPRLLGKPKHSAFDNGLISMLGSPGEHQPHPQWLNTLGLEQPGHREGL